MNKKNLLRLLGVWVLAGLLCLVGLLLSYALAVARSAPLKPPLSSPTAVSVITHTLSIPGGKPTAVEVYHTGNKFYVAETLGGNLLAFDGTTHQIEATIPISGIVLGENLVVNETYGRAYAASRVWDGSEFGTGSGLIYVVSTVTDTLLTTIDPQPLLLTSLYTLAHDETRDRVYVGGYGLAYIDVGTDAIYTVTLPPGTEPPSLFMANEMAINETTNTVYIVQAGYYGHHRLWILDANTWIWSWVDFSTLGAYYPQHVEVSETENKVIVKVIGIPGQAEPGLYIQDRDNGSYVFVGNEDYGEMDVNETTDRLFTGVEVGQAMAIVELGTNGLTNMPIAPTGSATAIGVRDSTDHAFLAGIEFIGIVDGDSRTTLKIPVPYALAGGILVQDVAVNQNTGWVYVIPDDDQPFVVAVQDPPAGPLQQFVYLPVLLLNG